MDALFDRLFERAMSGQSDLRTRVPSYYSGTANVGPAPFDESSDETIEITAGAEAKVESVNSRVKTHSPEEPSHIIEKIILRDNIESNQSKDGLPNAETPAPLHRFDDVKNQPLQKASVQKTDSAQPAPDTNKNINPETKSRQVNKAHTPPAQIPVFENAPVEASDSHSHKAEKSTNIFKTQSVTPQTISQDFQQEQTPRPMSRADYMAAVAQSILQPQQTESYSADKGEVKTQGSFSATEISINIGKLSIMPAAAPAPVKDDVSDWSPSLSIESYLQQRKEGQR